MAYVDYNHQVAIPGKVTHGDTTSFAKLQSVRSHPHEYNAILSGEGGGVGGVGGLEFLH